VAAGFSLPQMGSYRLDDTKIRADIYRTVRDDKGFAPCNPVVGYVA